MLEHFDALLLQDSFHHEGTVGRRVVLLREESPSCFLGSALADNRQELEVMDDGVNGAGAYVQTF